MNGRVVEQHNAWHRMPLMRMENSHIPQRPTFGIGQHQAFHGSDSSSNPRLSLLKIRVDYLVLFIRFPLTVSLIFGCKPCDYWRVFFANKANILEA
jgi:hypothetical protein